MGCVCCRPICFRHYSSNRGWVGHTGWKKFSQDRIFFFGYSIRECFVVYTCRRYNPKLFHGFVIFGVVELGLSDFLVFGHRLMLPLSWEIMFSLFFSFVLRSVIVTESSPNASSVLLR